MGGVGAPARAWSAHELQLCARVPCGGVCRDKRRQGVSARLKGKLLRRAPRAAQAASLEPEPQQQRDRAVSRTAKRAVSPLAALLLGRGRLTRRCCCGLSVAVLAFLWVVCLQLPHVWGTTRQDRDGPCDLGRLSKPTGPEPEPGSPLFCLLTSAA